jgi:hypothetical protein
MKVTKEGLGLLEVKEEEWEVVEEMVQPSL